MGAGERSAVDVARAFLAQASRTAPRLGTYLYLDEGSIVAAATEIDTRRKRGETLGALAGVPVAIKDNICVRGVPLTCGSRILERFRAPYDAHVIGRLRAAGALLYGKTNCDEFAMGSSTENSAYQPSRNPWDLARVPGGSSGGSAATVAAREAPLALGSDTGGSVRQPAAFCGVMGLKPTYGAVSRYGLVAFASSLDQIGPLATSARDAALLFNAISGPDERDMTSRPETRQISMENLERGVLGLKIGIARDLLGEGLDPEIRACFDAVSKWLVAEGASVVDVKLPHA
ncbi:MAG TPA: amidase, partial [Candidatus Dormibacteraeota bacterium]|nr:amidase [Candidatus Dormibacteraeota bacterium]